MSNISQFKQDQNVIQKGLNRFTQTLGTWLNEISRYLVPLSRALEVDDNGVITTNSQLIINKGVAVRIDNQDLNNINTTGFYSGPNLINAPNNGWFYVEVFQTYNENYIMQRVTSFGSNTTVPNTPNQSWQRVNDGGTWTAWKVLLA
jgi:hypothetical protein